MCQPLVLPDGRTGVLVAGDALPGLNLSPLWRFTLAECGEALRPVIAPVVEPPQTGAPVTPATQSDDIPRDRVRRAIHEVANPLTIMRNYVNLLSDRLDADSAVQRDLGIISGGAHRARHYDGRGNRGAG